MRLSHFVHPYIRPFYALCQAHAQKVKENFKKEEIYCKTPPVYAKIEVKILAS